MSTTEHVTVDAYQRAQDGFDEVLAAVPTGQWDAPSACAGWTARDVVGHVIWGQELVRHLATGTEQHDRTGAPGADSPGRLADSDPLAQWRAARATANAQLTVDALERAAPPQFVAAHPGATLADFLNVLLLDFLAHTWDVGHPLGIDVRLDHDLIERSTPVAHQVVVRAPGMFAAEQTPPPGADDQTRWLAFLGRSVQPR